MRSKLAAHIRTRHLFDRKDQLLLAFSGGSDSTVLCYLLQELGCSFDLAHCNYGLRGQDSEKDEKFCRDLAAKLNVQIHVKRMKFISQTSLSLQEEARHLRYAWFSELLGTHRYKFLLTAHHAGDQAETILLNLLRGTGLKGLRGIAEKEGHLVRPLLTFPKEEILAYAEEHNIDFREDKSNLSEKYRRNFLRHRVMPLLKRINPAAEKVFSANAHRFTDEYRLLNFTLEEESRTLLSASDSGWIIKKSKLLERIAPETILHHLLEPFSFHHSQITAIIRHLENGGESGKLFVSRSHRLSIDRTDLVIEILKEHDENFLIISNIDEISTLGGMKVKKSSSDAKARPNELLVNEKRLQWPLELRAPRQGEKFRPFGMKGQKLISDFLREQKLNAFEKEKVKVLVNGNGEIMWLIGFRSDERYRVTADDKNSITIIAGEKI